jgi:hypothetical protein
MNQFKWQALSIVISLAVVGCSESKSERQTSTPSKTEVKQTGAPIKSFALSDSNDGEVESTYVGACIESVGSVFTRTNEQGLQESCTVLSQAVVNGHCQQNLSCVSVNSPELIDTRGLCASNREGSVLSGPLNCIGD